jgi:hypothetical protein
VQGLDVDEKLEIQLILKKVGRDVVDWIYVTQNRGKL